MKRPRLPKVLRRIGRVRAACLYPVVAALLVGCGGQTNHSNEEPSPLAQGQLSIIDGSASVVASFSAPVADADWGEVSVPLPRQKTPLQSSLAASRSYYPLEWLWQYKNLLPHPELFCDEPADGEFAAIAAELGGFKKSTSIFIEPDATAPKIQSGLMLNNHISRTAPSLEAVNDGGAASVTIQRPNVVGRVGSKVFYLSDVYGLITVDYSDMPFQRPAVSCALPLPGQPQNFLVTETHLYAIIKDVQSLSSALLQFDITASAPQFVKGVLLEHQDVLDARLFNDTLVMYLRTYAAEAKVAQRPESAVPTESSDAQASLGFDQRVAPGAGVPIVARQYLYHELKVFSTRPSLDVTHRETFLPEGSEAPVTLQAPDPTAVYRYKSFNNFLSASGEYLLVTERVNERHFDGYQTRTRYRCSDYKITQTPYNYCRTLWDRVENPDYTPPPASGVLRCTGTLASCLKNDAPRVSRYIYVAGGQQCYSGSRNRYSCIAGSTERYEVPQYSFKTLTQVHAFRFIDGQFVRLDNHLARVGKDQSIEVVGRPFQLPGTVQKHDHMQFKGDHLYAITNDENTDAVSLHTLTIAGNSPIYVSALTLNKSEGYSSLQAVFSADTLYLSDGNYRASSNSDLITVSLQDPLNPTLGATVKIPTRLDQLFFADNVLLGVGTVRQKANTPNPYLTRGSVTSFTADSVENNSVILGADYNNYRNSYSYDDQVVTLDRITKRMFLPYSVSSPLVGSSSSAQQHRLTVAKFDRGTVREEGTLSFSQSLDRTVSINEQTAFGFSREFIHQLNFEADWSSSTLFDGEIPESIYYAHQFPTQVQKRVRPDVFDFRLIDSNQRASGKLLDKVSVKRATSQACIGEQVLFDRDKLVVVQEAPNTYLDYKDCPADRNQTAKVFTGYKISAEAFVPLADQKAMERIYIQSQWGMTCIVDVDNMEGEVIKAVDPDVGANLQCFTRAQFNQLLNGAVGALQPKK